jgi:hypothetical protein
MGNYPEESIQHSDHGESLKSRRLVVVHPDDGFGMKPEQVAIYCKQDSQCTYTRNNEARSSNRRYCGKAISVKNYERESSSKQTACAYYIVIYDLPGIVVQEHDPLGDFPRRFSFKMSFNCTSRDE